MSSIYNELPEGTTRHSGNVRYQQVVTDVGQQEKSCVSTEMGFDGSGRAPISRARD